MIFYLKHEKNVMLTGHKMDETCLILDTTAHMANLGNIAPDYKEIKGVICHGTRYEGGDYYSSRKSISFSYTIREKYSENPKRYHEIQDFIDAEEPVYFYQKMFDKTIYTKTLIPYDAKPEVWENFRTSKRLELKLLVEDPFFYEVEETIIPIEKNINDDISIVIHRKGKKTPFSFMFVFTTEAHGICIKIHDDVKAEYARSFKIGDELQLDLRDLKVILNGHERPDIKPVLPLSAPFPLLYKKTTLKICTNGRGTGSIRYRARFSK